MSFSVRQFQREQKVWAEFNFGEQQPYRQFLGVVEEVGELAHALLKQEQGIRNNENLRAKEIDAVADIVVFLAGFCNSRDIDLESAIADTWEQVKKRNWRAQPDSAHQGEGQL